MDTPGVGSIHKHNTVAAYAYVKESDAVIFLISVDSPINEIESEFLIEIKQYISKIYFAVNKIDLISDKDLEKYLKYCKDMIAELTGTKDINVFPISALASTDIGTKQLVDRILSDINLQGEEILYDSVKIKLIEKIREALALIEFKQNALQKVIREHCKNCGKRINQKKLKGCPKIYCSPECKKDWEDKSPIVYQHVCYYCGTELKTKQRMVITVAEDVTFEIDSG